MLVLEVLLVNCSKELDEFLAVRGPGEPKLILLADTAFELVVGVSLLKLKGTRRCVELFECTNVPLLQVLHGGELGSFERGEDLVLPLDVVDLRARSWLRILALDHG